jgi:hypothetical protein
VKKLISFFFTSFRRKPESSVFKTLAIDWTPVFTGVTAEIQFFHTFPLWSGGKPTPRGEKRNRLSKAFRKALLPLEKGGREGFMRSHFKKLN